MKEEQCPVLKLEYIDMDGSVYRQEAPLWDDELSIPDRIGWALNVFLRLMSFVRPNDYILTESLTEDEWEHLQDCLDKYRAKGAADDSDDL